jgi:LmbE family N-acetylglucosaminyl deacetylase
MTASLQFHPTDRVCVFAPHPDDETIACGEAIQAAREAGAAVRVVFATDGDNNPWPQRWLERRLRIRPAERRRWGERRRREALAALAALGLDPAGCVRFLAWPDQGLTALLMEDDAAIGVLEQELAAFAPTHAVVPSLADRHPDHNALRVMLDLALLRRGRDCQRLEYIVHGGAGLAHPRHPAGDAQRHARKRQALEAHASQVALSRRRLAALADAPERFGLCESGLPGLRSGPVPVVRVAQSALARLQRSHDLLLVLAGNDGIERWRLPLPRLPRLRAEGVLRATDGRTLAAEWGVDSLAVRLPERSAPALATYAKLDAAWPRLVVFDREGWQDAATLRSGAAMQPSRQAAAGLT